MLTTVRTTATITLLIMCHAYILTTKHTPLCNDMQKIVFSYLNATFDPEQTASLMPYLCRAKRKTNKKSVLSLYHLHNHYKKLIETTSKHKDYKKWFNSLSTAPKQIQYKIGKIWINKHIDWDMLFQKYYILSCERDKFFATTDISTIKILQVLQHLSEQLPYSANCFTSLYTTIRFKKNKTTLTEELQSKSTLTLLEKICYNDFIGPKYILKIADKNSLQYACCQELERRLDFCSTHLQLPTALMNTLFFYGAIPLYLYLAYSATYETSIIRALNPHNSITQSM